MATKRKKSDAENKENVTVEKDLDINVENDAVSDADVEAVEEAVEEAPVEE